jgi:hypothetical protein
MRWVYPDRENEVVLPHQPLDLWAPCKARGVWAGARPRGWLDSAWIQQNSDDNDGDGDGGDGAPRRGGNLRSALIGAHVLGRLCFFATCPLQFAKASSATMLP